MVPATGASPDPDELREHVRKSLRGSRTPDRVVFRDELPTNATGKVLRRELVSDLKSATKEPNMIKNGTRLQSQVCDTQVIVVQAADSLDDLRAGGVPMVPLGRRESRRRLAGPGVVRRQRDGQALRRRDRRRGARHQGRARAR